MQNPIFNLIFVALTVSWLWTDIARCQEFDPTKTKGDLQKIKEPLSELIKFQSKGGRLAAEVDKDRQSAYQKIGRINSIGGNRGGGSSSSGNTWEIRINNNAFEGSCSYGYSRVYPKPDPETWKIKLKELKAPNRDLSIEAGPNGEISLTLYGGDDPYLLRIRQFKSGSIFVQEISDTEIFSESSPSFDAFCRNHSRFTQNRLLPMIRHIGIDAPMTQFDTAVQKSVISFLTPIKQERLTSFQTSFKNLDSSDYDKRKADAQKLGEGFADWRDFVLKAVNDTEFSYEVRFRLMEALEKHGKPEEVKASRYAISSGLADNPEYLIWLYQNHDDDSIRENIIAHLQKTTGEDLGSDIALWKKKFDSEKSLEVRADGQPAVDLFAEKGSLESVNDFLGQLVRLRVEEKKLKLDRSHWSQQFDGKSIQQLVKETNENLAKLNMPANYDPDPLFELGSVSHPQAIFAKMRNKLEKTTKRTTVYYYSYNRTSSSSLNRQFNNNDLSVSMEFEPNTTTVRRVVSGSSNADVKPPKLDDKPFKLNCQELNNAKRSMIIHEQKDGRLRVALVTEQSNAFVQMLQKPDGGFIVQDVRGSEIFTAKGDSFEEFLGNHKSYCMDRLFPLFAHFGISFDKELFVPTEKDVDESSEKKTTEKETAKGTAVSGAQSIDAAKLKIDKTAVMKQKAAIQGIRIAPRVLKPRPPVKAPPKK